VSNLLAALSTSGHALGVYQSALETIQNNITNASTPGFASQRLHLEALPFDVTSGLAGGVAAWGIESSRDAFVEEQVRTQLHAMGRDETQAEALSTIETLFGVSDRGGVAAALNDLFGSFSAWSASPSSTVARDSVLSAAGALADRVRGLAWSLEDTSANLDGQIDSAVHRINELAGNIQACNKQRLTQTEVDPALDARLNANLEELAEWLDFATVQEADGQVTVVLSGGTPLVVGEQVFALKSAEAGAQQGVPGPSILGWQDQEVTSQITGGKLAGLLDVRNRVLGEMHGDGKQAGSLNQFAAALADNINSLLESAYVSAAPGARSGVALFTYDDSYPTCSAATLRVNPDITADLLAPADASGSNGAALKVASLQNSTELPELGGTSLVSFFANITAAVGRESAASASQLDSHKQAVAQMRTLRDQVSAVSLDEQAVLLLQFQRSYTAAARVLTVLDQLLETAVNLVR
jgi:flagellar hook-associated protein 1